MTINRRQFLLNSTAVIGTLVIPSGLYIASRWQLSPFLQSDVCNYLHIKVGGFEKDVDPLNEPHLVYVRSHNGISPKNSDKP